MTWCLVVLCLILRAKKISARLGDPFFLNKIFICMMCISVYS